MMNKIYKNMLTVMMLSLITASAFAQSAKITAKELYKGKTGTQTITVYIETVQSFSKEFNDYITTAYKGWYQKGNTAKIFIRDDWEGSGPMEFEETIKGKKIKTLELEEYSEEGGPKTLKGVLEKNGKKEEVTLALIKTL